MAQRSGIEMRDVDQIILTLLQIGRLRADPATGNVYAPKSNYPDKPIGTLTNKGYLRACINFEGKQVHVMLHRVVWISVHGIPASGLQIDHGVEGKAVNRIANLEAVTGDENMRRAADNGLTNGGWRDAERDPVTGQFLGKKAAGRLLDGREWSEMPEASLS